MAAAETYELKRFIKSTVSLELFELTESHMVFNFVPCYELPEVVKAFLTNILSIVSTGVFCTCHES